MSETFVRLVAVQDSGGGETELFIHQEKVGDVGVVVWDAALVLAYYLQTKKGRGYVSGKNVIELGSGTGIVGIVASFCGAKNVLLTDLPSLVPLMQKNIEANEKKILGVTKALSLTWGEEIPPTIKSFDAECILIADCVYYESAVRPLAQSVVDMMSGRDQSVCLCAYEDRDTTNKEELQDEFMRILTDDFGLAIDFVPFNEMHPEFRSDDIHIIRISRKPHNNEWSDLHSIRCSTEWNH